MSDHPQASAAGAEAENARLREALEQVRAQKSRAEYIEETIRLRSVLFTAEARVTELEAALEQVKAQQPETLTMIEANGFVFDSIGNEPGNWQHLAFTIYTDLCRVDTIAAAALAKEDTA